MGSVSCAAARRCVYIIVINVVPLVPIMHNSIELV